MSTTASKNRQLAVDGHQNFSNITDTAWPDSSPSKYEERLLSVCCGNTSLKWAIHEGVAGNFLPILFWSTPAPSKDETETGDPCSILERHLPPGGHELIFGTRGAPADKKNANKAAAERRVPTLTVYVVSSNRSNEAGVEAMFKDIPCRIYRMTQTDFYSPEGGTYEGMGIDRLSNMRAATKFYGSPLLVIDGGTALTYTGANAQGKLIGGGIYPGVAATIRSLHDYTGALPLLSQEDVEQAATRATANQAPLPVFAKDTKTAIITTTLKGLSSVCWNAVNVFKQQVIADKDHGGGGDAEEMENVEGAPAPAKNNDNDDLLFTICVTGGDMVMIDNLLKVDHNNILPSQNPSTAMDGIEISKHRNLCHYGVGTVLSEKSQVVQLKQSEDDLLRAEIVGQRVAKRFQIGKEEKIYRGAVAATAAGKDLEDDWFFVRYDDGDTEHLSITGLYDGLSLFNALGEADPAAMEGEKGKKKVAQAKETVDMLISKSAAVKKHSETPVDDRKAANSRKRGPGGSSKSAPPSKASKTKSFSKKQDPHSYVNLRCAKAFGPDVYFGTITKYITPPTARDDELWHVLYDDDDSEDFDSKDLRRALSLYKANIASDKKSRVTESSGAGIDEETEAEAEPEDADADDAAVAPVEVEVEAPSLADSAPIAMEVDSEQPVAEAAAPAEAEPAGDTEPV